MHQHRILLFRIVLATFGIYAFTEVYYLFANYLAELGMSSARAGVLVGAFFASTILCRPFGGVITERLGVRRTMIAAACLCGAGSLGLLGAGTSFPAIFAARVVMGAGFSLFLVALATYQGLAIPEQVRGSFFALTCVGSIAPLFTILPTAEVLLFSGHVRLYLGLAPLAAVLCFAMSFSLEPLDASGALPKNWGTFAELMGSRGYPTLLLSALCFSLPDAAIVYVARMASEAGLSPSAFMIPVALAAIGVRVFGRDLLDRIPRTSVAAPAFALMGVALFGASYGASTFVLAFFGTLYGVGVGYAHPIHLALVSDIAAPSLRAKGTSLLYLTMDIAWFVVPLGLGFLGGITGLPDAFRAAAFVTLGAAVGIHLLWLRVEKTRSVGKSSEPSFAEEKHPRL
jgi:MFS family permease